MADSGDRFLDRWSRRKRVQSGVDQSEPESPPAPAVVSESSQPELPDEAETAAMVESLPDIETLDENADFTAFLRKGVPEALRRRALRKLWRLNPVFANLDGLNDYDEDFTLATSALTQVKTIYQVGKGMLGAEEPEETVESVADAAGEPAVPASGPADSGESANDLEIESQAALPDSAGEALSDASQAAAEPPPMEPAPVVAADAKPAKSGSAAERRWGRFKG